MTPELATRAHGLRILENFAPRMGRAYAIGRNYDCGPGNHRDVSQLSPYIRRRLVSEHELVATALETHGYEGAEKFIQEVVWRGYFKGWLERRPRIWSDYRDGLIADLADADTDPALRSRLDAALTGSTGLAYFDAWVEELITTGYLHNHARMWFASIWIFTLGLPWRIGADFFFRHLHDGDPASNTCSWRWVAGLHTRGKVYEAQAWNIAKFTQGRFSPRDADLAVKPEGLQGQEPDDLPETTPLRQVNPPRPGVATVVLLIEDDCQIEAFDLDALDICGAATLATSHLRSPLQCSPDVSAFEATALKDAAVRAGLTAVQCRAGPVQSLVEWVEKTGARQIAMPYAPVGPVADWTDALRPLLRHRGIALTEWRRDWDALIWPHATAGFFKVKKRIPKILEDIGLA
ncbi:FAD-binding domain-containing protein [Lutimaribacter marinistellae]|uniref:FAD-binding domain-containing protein n=1 Tax=Lutimaribacter marinistellae TaxID=1820329 RepID=A0ABV7TED3_9RHOB